MLDAFKIKPYDLESVFATWTDGPVFKGDPKKDTPVDEWLDKIKTGCEERKIPEEYWYKVAQHFMGPKAKARLNELKVVIAKVHGGKYRWSWKKFKVAMQNMGWGIDANQTQAVKVSKTGSWWTLKKKDKEGETPDAFQRQTPSRSNSTFWTLRKSSEEEAIRPAVPPRSESTSFWRNKKSSEDDQQPAVTSRAPTRSSSRDSRDDREATLSSKRLPPPPESVSDSSVVTLDSANRHPTPSRSNSGDTGMGTTITQAPVWLLNACNALEYITSEHPKAMSIISAILITAGSIPAIPAISAGAGGAILASGTAHAIGAIAIGLGQALGTTVKNQNQNRPDHRLEEPPRS